MAKEITIKLNTSSVSSAIRELERYQRQLEQKVRTFLERLAQIGVDSVNTTIGSIPAEQLQGATTVINPIQGSDGNFSISYEFQGSQVAFIEFSAGITYGTSDYPLPSGAGMGMGTYNPEGGNWDNPEGWYYWNGTNRVHTYGNPAYMPMYHSTQEIIQAVDRIAREVFSF